MEKMNKYQQEKLALENAFARRMLLDFNIKEVTTRRQAKNGTREFEFPVHARKYTISGRTFCSKDKLRLAVFKTGYVRNQNGCSSNYQLNKQYKQNVRWTLLDGSKLITHKSVMIAREKIYSGMARLNYMLEFYKRNYLN